MGSFRLNQSFIDKIESKCKRKANELAVEASEKLTDYYMTLLDWYYVGYTPKYNEYGEPYYERTFNLYKSVNKYLASNSTRYYGGVKIDSHRMSNYFDKDGELVSANAILDTYIYNQEGTWHGGDWHGGYGEQANFNIYNELLEYKNELMEDFQKRCKK